MTELGGSDYGTYADNPRVLWRSDDHVHRLRIAHRAAEICVFTSSSGSWKRTFASTRQRLHVAPSLIQIVPIGCQSVPLSWTVNHGPAPQKRPSSHIRNQMCFNPTRTAVPFASIG